MNSTMGPIFNENFVEKKKFVDPVNNTHEPLKGA